MKKSLSLPFVFYVLAFLAVLSLSFPQISTAKEEYPSTCPPEAIAIVNAVGGCAAVNPQSFSAVYDKCCASAEPADASTGTPTYLGYTAVAFIIFLGLGRFIKKQPKARAYRKA